jgi:uncharacterized membrane protein (DUF4010 family)
MNWLTGWVPLEGIKIVLVLFLSFLVGAEREESYSQAQGDQPAVPKFGGVRTFPLIGLTGYGMALLSGGQALLIAAGFLGVSGFLVVSYSYKLRRYGVSGVTTEISGLVIYIVGALVSRGEFWIATTIAIAVILPIVPHRTLGPFAFNPFKTWLIVVAASAISYGSYLLQRFARRGGIFLAAVLGGAYSSTVTTVVLAKRAREEDAPGAYAGGILMASGTMFLRILILLALFNRMLLSDLAAPFLLLAVVSLAGGWLWSKMPASGTASEEKLQVKNPLAISTALFFALMFTALLIATHYAVQFFGRGGMYGLAGLSGLVDVDPFVLGLTQSAGGQMPQALAATGILVAVSSNNVMKGIYAYIFAGRRAGLQAAALLGGLALLGLLPLLLRR